MWELHLLQACLLFQIGITSPLKTACCEQVIGKGQDKKPPSRNVQEHSGLVAIVPAASRGYKWCIGGSELLVVGEISGFFY